MGNKKYLWYVLTDTNVLNTKLQIALTFYVTKVMLYIFKLALSLTEYR